MYSDCTELLYVNKNNDRLRDMLRELLVRGLELSHIDSPVIYVKIKLKSCHLMKFIDFRYSHTASYKFT